jgi:hypothetical protein
MADNHDKNDVEEVVTEEFETVFEGTQPSDDLASYLEVEAKVPAQSKMAKGYFKFGKDLQEAIELFGEEVVFSNFRAQAKIKLQALMRSWVDKGKSVADLLAQWKPGVQMERTPVDPLVAAENKFDNLSADEQQAFLEKLIARQQG